MAESNPYGVSRFEFEILSGDKRRPRGVDEYLFPRDLRAQGGWNDGLAVVFHPTSRPAWLGRFPLDSGWAPAVTRWPDGRRVLIAAGDDAFLVNAEDPEDWSRLPVSPLRIVHVAADLERIVLGDFTELLCYGHEGMVWRSGRLVLDWLTLHGRHGDALRCSGMLPDVDDHPFEVDLRGGTVVDRQVLAFRDGFGDRQVGDVPS